MAKTQTNKSNKSTPKKVNYLTFSEAQEQLRHGKVIAMVGKDFTVCRVHVTTVKVENNRAHEFHPTIEETGTTAKWYVVE